VLLNGRKLARIEHVKFRCDGREDLFVQSVNVTCGLIGGRSDGYASVTFDHIIVTITSPSVPTASHDVTFR